MISQLRKQEEEILELQARISMLENRNEELSKKLRINQSLYLSVLDSLPMNIFLEDREGHTIFANKQACIAHGTRLEDLIGKTVFDFFPPSIAEINRAYDLEVWSQRKLVSKEMLAGFQGKEHHMYSGKTIIHLDESKEDFLLGFGLDISDRVAAEERLRESEEKFRSVIEQASDSLFLIGTDGTFKDFNPTASEILSYSKEALLEMNVENVFTNLPEKMHLLLQNSNESSNFEDIMRGKDHVQIPVDINIRRIHIGENEMYLALCRDIREKKKAEAQIKHMAYHDALTNLPNRWYIQSYLKEYISNEHTNQSMLGVILLDLDFFKVINDSLGHEAGDLLLQNVSKRLESVTSDNEVILSRFGGDEFILLAPKLEQEEDIIELCENVMGILKEPFYIYEQKFNISASVGISIYPKDGNDLNTLINNADLAMYDSKDYGRGCYRLFQPIMKKNAMERMDMEILIREALEENEFILHYQPKQDLSTGHIYGMEALIRWKNKENIMLYPDSFIPIAEETGLIIPIGEWVLREACKQCKAWQDAGYDQLTVSVNLSPKQFQKQDLVDSIESILLETGLPPWALELELTEGMIMGNPEEAVAILNSLKAIGIKLSIDDFGTGFSSLSYLKLFPIDILKIDKSFIMNLDEANTTIALAVISLAHNLHLQVVAEGVESEAHYNFLLRNHCDFAQGYFISKPLTPHEFHLYLNKMIAV